MSDSNLPERSAFIPTAVTVVIVCYCHVICLPKIIVNLILFSDRLSDSFIGHDSSVNKANVHELDDRSSISGVHFLIILFAAKCRIVLRRTQCPAE